MQLKWRKLLNIKGKRGTWIKVSKLMEQGLLFVPFARTSTTQAHEFSVVGPTMWTGLPLAQRLLPGILSNTFYSTLKTILLVVLGTGALLSSNLERRYINLRNE